MSAFSFIEGTLYAEDVPVKGITEQFGTPVFVYSRAAIESAWHALDSAFGNHPHNICYAVKANSNIAVLNILARLGSGFDVVSEGELRRVLKAGGDANKTVFSGVAKSADELRYAMQSGIGCINVESLAELHRVQDVAASVNRVQAIALRVNPDVDPKTHPYISTGLKTAKFGINMDQALDVYRQANQMPNLEISGVACHIGSQITSTQPFADALDRVIRLHDSLLEEGISLNHLDLGGGLGIDYQGEDVPSAEQYVAGLLSGFKKHGITLPISIEPGRYIAGNAGILVSRVEYLKPTADKNFLIVDAGMNDLLRPALYQAHHEIINVDQKSSANSDLYDVVGPVCESADVLGYERRLAARSGDLVAVMSAGAYSFVMANNYNTRRRPAEIMVDRNNCHVIRPRESFDDLFASESLLP